MKRHQVQTVLAAGHGQIEVAHLAVEPMRSDAAEEDAQERRRRSVPGLCHGGDGVIRALAWQRR